MPNSVEGYRTSATCGRALMRGLVSLRLVLVAARGTTTVMTATAVRSTSASPVISVSRYRSRLGAAARRALTAETVSSATSRPTPAWRRSKWERFAREIPIVRQGSASCLLARAPMGLKERTVTSLSVCRYARLPSSAWPRVAFTLHRAGLALFSLSWTRSAVGSPRRTTFVVAKRRRSACSWWSKRVTPTMDKIARASPS